MKSNLKKLLKKCVTAYGLFAALPFYFRKSHIDEPIYVSHDKWADFLEAHFNKSGMRILEIGSRNVTGSNLRSRFNQATYVGFDFYSGENVDIVGDPHQLSSYFEGQEPFDLIFSSAVFEHLHMPWVAAQEIQKLLKVGGYVFIETHFSFSSHERPWHFFQFSDKGLRSLFNSALGFDLIDSGMSNPMAGFFGPRASKYLRFSPIIELYCHSEILCRKRCELSNFAWDQVGMDDIVEGARYPDPIFTSKLN